MGRRNVAGAGRSGGTGEGRNSLPAAVVSARAIAAPESAADRVIERQPEIAELELETVEQSLGLIRRAPNRRTFGAELDELASLPPGHERFHPGPLARRNGGLGG